MKFVREPETERKMLAATLMVCASIAVLLLVLWLIEASGTRVNSDAFGRMFAPTVAVMGIIGWRWPESVLRPFSSLWQLLRRR